MNRLRFIILWLGVALLASCSTDMEPVTQPSELQAIQLTAQGVSSTEPTRAASTSDLQNTAFAAGEDVAVYLVDNASATTYATTPYRFRAEAAVDGHNTLNYYSDATTPSTLYYPTSGSAINIYGFYPYNKFSSVNNRSTTDLDVSVNADQSTAANYRSSDIMIGVPTDNNPVACTSSAVGLTFRHLMAKLVIRLKQGVHSGTSSVVTATNLANSTLTIGSVTTEATLNMTNGSVTTGSNSANVTVASSTNLYFYYNNANTTISSTEYAIVLPPQALTGKTITITTGANETISGTLPTLSLTAGSSTVLTLTVNDSGIEASRTNYGNGGSTTWE